ncbi:MAG: glucose-6-phosphate isomerase, partial [Planctomycetota bacterium]
MSVRKLKTWTNLKKHTKEISKKHLRDLIKDPKRAKAMSVEAEGITLDFSRQNATPKTMSLLLKLAEEAGLKDRIRAMLNGKRINATEDRAVLHTALRADAKAVVRVDGKNVIPDVQAVLKKIKTFSEKVRSGKVRGITRKKFTDVVAVGIGGSYLGPEFVYEAMRTDKACAKSANGMRLRFLANVDPIDVTRALEGLNPETTLVIIVSKTFTTAETILNARTVRAWLVKGLGEKAVAKHMIAVSTALDKVEAFGINPENAFGFWDWVGGRYSVCSAVGVLPLSLVFGFKPVSNFLAGARSIDQHFAR